MTQHETLQAGLAAVGALMTVLAGDGRKDRGLLAKRHEGTVHLRECNIGMWLDSVYPYDSNPEVQTDLRTWAKAIVATGAHPGAWVREVVEDSAALAASSAEPSTVTTRTITIRCHCGRGVSVGADPWCEGCVQSAATCDCVPATQGRGDA